MFVHVAMVINMRMELKTNRREGSSFHHQRLRRLGARGLVATPAIAPPPAGPGILGKADSPAPATALGEDGRGVAERLAVLLVLSGLSKPNLLLSIKQASYSSLGMEDPSDIIL